MKTTVKRKMTCTLAAALLVTAMAGTAFAGSAIKLQLWKTNGSCKDCDLSNLTIPIPAKIDKVIGLENANLTGATFATGVSLAGYNLKNATFTGAKLNGASIQGANVTQASFQDAQFGTADVTGLTALTTQTINFQGADLKTAKKTKTFPAGAHLGNAKWTSSLTCDNDGTSMGGCKIKQKCPNPHSGFVDPTGACAD
jgi:uncharacterized protein YjbI with pentapeptide repeats